MWESPTQFYHSVEWRKFLQALKMERLNDDGQIICPVCGLPVVKAYDCIGHHKIELTPENVNDYSISLNPDLVELIHFKCHNKVHGRFSGKHEGVFLVYGSPCAGKTTWVKQNAGFGDFILDIDVIWEAVSVSDRFHKPGALKQNVFQLFDIGLEQIKNRLGQWHNAFIIGSYPLRTDRDRIGSLTGAEPVFVEEKKEVCLSRAPNDEWRGYIEEWFDDFVE